MGIESTCDETACSIVRDGHEILSNVISTQIDLHEEYGGVVPELACRRHIETIIPVIDEALNSAKLKLENIDLFAVANGPGLIGALLIGINATKALSFSLDKPLIGVNHIEAHLYASLMSCNEKILFPCLGLVVSGGHTALVIMKDIGVYQLIGQTVDDAIGEAFDKVAKILGLSYPGGPKIEALAQTGDVKHFKFKSGNVKGRPYDFSFSGLKTGVLYAVKGNGSGIKSETIIANEDKKHIAAAFQYSAFNDIVGKIKRASEEYGLRSIVLGGGVTNNRYFRELLAKECVNLTCYWPSAGLSLDNAAMIAGLGYHNFIRRGYGDSMELEALTSMPLA